MDTSLRLDVRYPIGLFFAILGVLIGTYGFVTLERPGATPTGVPIDIVWGILMLVFGAFMLFLAERARRARIRAHDAAPGSSI
ncbi:MAG TPA: hypothetical protein VJ992_09145 [Gemmatimonadales bacterium]|nr:hypothetical protein [Gemmatimonadales bacterium]